MCVSKKIQIDVFISHIPAPHRLCASCPLPPMTQCPSAPKKHTHTHTVPWLSPDQSSAAVYLQPWENGTTALILSCVSITLHTRRLGVLPGLKTEWEFGGKWISNIKERVCFRVCAERGWGGTPQLRKWATEAAMCAGAAVKSAWSNRFCLSGTTTSESNWKSGGDLERAVDSQRERGRRRKMSKKKKKVILSALQSGKAGVFSDQPLTRLMVIFLHRRRFTVKGSRLPAAFLSLFTLPSFCFSSSPLLVNGVPADASLCFVFFTLLISPPTKCSCFKYIHQLL